MKKIILIAAIAMGGLMLASCSSKKECKCTMKYSDNSIAPVETTSTLEKGECSDLNTTATTSGITATMTCVQI